jgi:hypothetical protein
MSFGFKHDIFSLALMNIFGFHAINSAFSKCFPKKGKEQNHSSAHPAREKMSCLKPNDIVFFIFCHF